MESLKEESSETIEEGSMRIFRELQMMYKSREDTLLLQLAKADVYRIDLEIVKRSQDCKETCGICGRNGG